MIEWEQAPSARYCHPRELLRFCGDRELLWAPFSMFPWKMVPPDQDKANAVAAIP
jgi:hypothetical protein